MLSVLWSLNSTNRVSSQMLQPGYSFVSTLRPKKCILVFLANVSHSANVMRLAFASLQRFFVMCIHGCAFTVARLRSGGSPGSKGPTESSSVELNETSARLGESTRFEALAALSSERHIEAATSDLARSESSPLKGCRRRLIRKSSRYGLYHMAKSTMGMSSLESMASQCACQDNVNSGTQ